MGSAVGSESYVAIIKADPANPRDIPATPAMSYVNFTDEDMGAQITTKVSDHIRPDRMTTDITRTGFTVGGGYNFEFTFENSPDDEMLVAMLWSDNGWEAGGSLDEVVKNGKTYQPFYIERGHPDAGATGEYFKFMGMCPNTMSLSLEDQSDVTGNFTCVGLNAIVEETQEVGATYADLTQNGVFSTVTDIAEIRIDGAIQDSCIVKNMTIELNNNVTPKTGLGVLGACETKAHRLLITGTLTMYFNDAEMYRRFTGGTEFSVQFTLVDGDANSYIVILPRVKLDADQVNTTGIDDDVMDDATYTALYDQATDSMIMIERTTPV